MTDQPVAESYMKPVDHGLRPHGHPARHLHDGADGPRRAERACVSRRSSQEAVLVDAVQRSKRIVGLQLGSQAYARVLTG